MRKQWASEQPLHSSSSQFRTRVASTMENAITPALLRRHHGLGRFSLRRLFGSLSFGRRPIMRRCNATAEVDTRSDNGSFTLDHQKQQQQAMGGSTKTVSGLSTTTSSTTTTEPVLECPVCALELALPCFPVLSTCPHRTCYDCLQRYLQVEISESRVNLTCPLCPELIHPNDIRMVLNDDNLLGKYERFMLRRVLVTEPDARWCPAPDCGYVVIASSCASCPKLRCERPGCGTYFCYHCKHEWHPNQTCDTARAQRYPHPANPRSASQDSFSQRDDIKPCPCCKVPIIKMDDGSCNHMTCQVCGTEFCWLCMKEISDLHYLSPSGCTFWGKKPWSRKKKIFWQLGMLVGAPVGIALIAGIAVPAIIIGIPVWVGRKLHAKYKSQGNKHKKNLVVTGGVMASVLVSPILAGITVGIGVPILLAYVYGVVPISLCRSGGCGVTTSASGVRIEFDEEEPGTTTAAAEATGSTHRLDGPPPSKLEVSADLASNKRFSLSSHSETASATVSLRSATLADDAASTKALAGSLLGYRDNTAVTPVEVHVDCSSSRTKPSRNPTADPNECIVSFIDESQGSLDLEGDGLGAASGIKRKSSTKSVRVTYLQSKGEAVRPKVRNSQSLDHLYPGHVVDMVS